MRRPKVGFWDGIVDVVAGFLIELPFVLLFGGRALWEEPPLVAAAWIIGFALVFFIVIRIDRGDTKALADLARADRAARERRSFERKRASLPRHSRAISMEP